VNFNLAVDPDLVLEPAVRLRNNRSEAPCAVDFDLLDEGYAVRVFGGILVGKSRQIRGLLWGI
jgi:hypothetical protein